MKIQEVKESLHRSIKAFIHKGETHYVAECLEISVVTQGKTLEETITNLQEAVALHLAGEDPADCGLIRNPALLITIEIESSLHVS